MTQIEVKVGQVWVDNDPRQLKIRHLRVEEIKDGKVKCAVFYDRRGAGWTKISLHRFKPTSNGYRLEVDVKEGEKPSSNA